MAYKEYRDLKVYERCNYGEEPKPQIVLSGKWLNNMGFEQGDRITVQCQGGKLIITKTDEVLAE